MTMTTLNMHTHRTSNMNTNLTMNTRLTTNVFPVKHNTNTNRNVFVNNFVNELPKPPLRLWQQPLCGGESHFDEIIIKLQPFCTMSNDLVVTTMNIGRSGEIGRNGEIGRSGKIGRSDEIVDKLNPNTNMANVRPLRPNIGRCGKIVEKLNPNTNTNVFDEIVVKFKFKFNAMKLLENKNVFVNDFVNKPPQLKFKVMKLVENKSVVLSWVYLQPFWGYLYPFCNTLFTLFTLFSIFARATKNTSALVRVTEYDRTRSQTRTLTI